jgi:hypothetical protein
MTNRRLPQRKVVSQQIVFKPFGKCIYCGSPGDPDLSVEHIIPESLGGTFEFLEASCHECAVKTGAVEGHVVSRLYGDTRAFLGMRRGKKRKWPEKFSVHVKVKAAEPAFSGVMMTMETEGFEKKEVDLDNLPGAMIILNLPHAGIFTGAPLSDEFQTPTCDIAFAEGWRERLKRLDGRVILGGVNKLSPDQFGLFLAKIAHSYAVAMLRDTFEPFLASAIRQERPLYLSHYVGGQIPIEPPRPTDHLHTLQIFSCGRPNGEMLVAVRIRLFAVDNLSTYDVVVGRATDRTRWP